MSHGNLIYGNAQGITNIRGQGSRFFIVPLNDKQLYVWGTFNSTIPPESRVLGGAKDSSEFVKTFKGYRGWGIPKMIELIEKVNKKIHEKRLLIKEF